MRIRTIHMVFFSALLMVFTYSCAASRNAAKKDKCKKISDKDLTAILFAKDTIPFDFFFTNLGVDIKSEKINNWFASTVKMRIDSAFSGTVKFGPVVGATYLIRKDSIFIANKNEKCYIKENIDFISSMLGAEFQYDFLQDLLLGLPVGLDKSWEYKQTRNKEYYVLATKKKRKYRRIESEEVDEEISIQYFMKCKDYDLEKINIQIPSDTVDMTIYYKDKKEESGYIVPNITHLFITSPDDSIKIAINSGRVKINQPKSVRINISDSYNECP